jgi:hypothetical protein
LTLTSLSSLYRSHPKRIMLVVTHNNSLDVSFHPSPYEP